MILNDINIVSKEEIEVYIQSIEFKNTYHFQLGGNTFLLIKFADCRTNKFLFSYIANKVSKGDYRYEYIKNKMDAKAKSTIIKYRIKLSNPAYRICTWDAIGRGEKLKARPGEVVRDDNNNPIPYTDIIIYADLDKHEGGYPRKPIDKVIQDEYISVDDHPNVDHILNFNSKKYYSWMHNKIDEVLGNK